MPSRAGAAMGLAAGAAGAIGLKILDQKTNLMADLRTAPKLVKFLTIMAQATRERTMADLFTDSAKKWPDNTFIIFEHHRLTFWDMEMLSNQIAEWFLAHGLKRGDVLALCMENKADFVALWLGMAKIAVQVALLNYNIKQKGLVHCIKVAGSAGVVFDADTAEGVREVQDNLEGLKLIHWGGVAAGQWSVAPLSVTSDKLLGLDRDGANFKDVRKGLKMTDNFGFIYTSGTTGLPKAAQMPHVKFATMGVLGMAAGVAAGERMYNCLPIYHSSGGGIVVNSCLLTGGTVVLARKFSTSRFWSDILAYNCTGFQYIGELGRYLVNHAKDHPEVLAVKHRLKFACGNGLRPEIWDDFQDGFRIPLVVEFYASTEGVGALLNFSSKHDKSSRGAVGRMGSLLKTILKVKIVKFDLEAEDVVRGPDGFCIECDHHEAGEMVVFNETNHPGKSFKGYTDEKATKKKLLTDVFKKGDCWYRTGDLLATDERGYYYFIDRIGDTFRWKGENCSTMEVSEVVSKVPGVEEANVYGVKVPGSDDGRGCMVAMTGSAELKSLEKLEELRQLCQKELPAFSQPLFIRILREVEATGTFKQNKVKLREQGCDPNQAGGDPLFWLDPRTRRYAPFGDEEYQLLSQGQSRL